MRTKLEQLREAVRIAETLLRDAKDNRAGAARLAVLRDRLDNARANLADGEVAS